MARSPKPTRSGGAAADTALPTLSVLAVDDGPARALPPQQQVQVQSRRRLRPGAARDAAATATPVAPDEVVRVEYQNGLVMWTRADDLLRERGHKTLARGDGTAHWQIDAGPRNMALRSDVAPGADRGALGLGIKLLEFFGVRVTEGAARAIGTRFERRQLGRDPGLYRVDLSPALAMAAIADGPGTVKADQPVLLFLHGTMSSFGGSYRDLAAAGNDETGRAAQALRQQFAVRYGQEMYAWEHRSLSESPIQNALALVQQLPVGARLHLISHSRGGLVGELLCLAQRDHQSDPLTGTLLDGLFAGDHSVGEQLGLNQLGADELAAHQAAYAEDRQRLLLLLKELDERRIQVQRFVRVACPARGTTLASGRLDRWLSVVDALVPDGLFGDALDFLLAVVKERTDPRTLPGLEAMMPGSALTRLLQMPGLSTSADLSVIAGDVQGKGLWGQFKLLALDWFYAADHDLVVNTGSMYGGMRRPDGGARWRRDQGEQVTHFHYFRNPSSMAWLGAALAREQGSDAGFLPIATAVQQEPRWRSAVRASRASATPRPIVVVIPGTMGSALAVNERPVWLAYLALLKGGLGDIGIDATGVAPVDLLDNFYGPLLEHLAQAHRVEILPYDWRRSVRQAAVLLTSKLEALLPEAERSGQPLHIVAHSMGGLVARAMIADGGAGAAAWRRMTQLPGSRLLMLGTPNRGSFEAVRWLTGENPTQAKLILLDFTRGSRGVVDVVRRFPGLAELLPFDQEPNPWAQTGTWRALKTQLAASWPLVDEAVLREAQSTWTLLRNAAVPAEHMLYVAGCQPATVVGHQVVDESEAFTRQRLRWIASADGDGTVAWASGRLPGVPTYYAPDTGHDQLCSNSADRRIFRGYVDLLASGRTDQLAITPPGGQRSAAASENFLLPDLPLVDDLPDEASVRQLGFGGTRGKAPGEADTGSGTRLQVSVRHGDLRYARYPVLVGHYQGDTIVSAEAVLDHQLKGSDSLGPLTRRRDLGLYPGPQGTHAVFFNPQPGGSPVGALVVGLGQVGELTPGRLEAGVRDLLLDHALRLLQRGPGQGEAGAGPASTAPTRLQAKISCLLVGTGAGSLSLADSAEALLRGAVAANRKLETARLDQQVLISHIEFMELYEDLALGAAQALSALVGSADLGPQLHWPQRLVVEGEGRLRRSRFEPDNAWWQRVEITEDRDADRLRFVLIGDRARAEETLAMGQLRLADRFIAQACGSASQNAEVSKTLFEMLLPQRLKESTPDQRSTVLLLDEASARFPWELLEDRFGHDGRPPAVVAGMVRQLKEQNFRERPVHAFEQTALVVGNPQLDGWLGFADLPGARREAQQVVALLGAAGYRTEDAIDASADTVLNRLHARPWRLLHLAGHGEHGFDILQAAAPALATPVKLPDGREALPLPQKKLCSGMVIGPGVFLTPGDVVQMRHVPELVFINCCHLGNTGGGARAHNLLAANLGVEFIRMGVRAVVCAGWAVDDAAALSFAQTFYTALLQGSSFGQSVLLARQTTHAAHPGANTWGAYQCYGDPGYRLQHQTQRQTPSIAAPYLSPAELVTDLGNLAEATRMGSLRGDGDEAQLQRRLRERIDGLLQRIPEPARGKGRGQWVARADVCAALGFAHGEGRMFADALQWLGLALAGGQGDCPLRVVEQHANFSVRLAAMDWAQARSADPALAPPDLLRRQAELAQRIALALKVLEPMTLQAPNGERQALLGGAQKRLAWIQAGPQRRQAMRRMAEHYRQALDSAGGDDAYAFTNWAVACLLLQRLDPGPSGGDWHGPLGAMVQQQREATLRAQQDSPTLWRATGLADLMLVELLMAADDARRCEQLGGDAAAQYRLAFDRGASPRERSSIQEHVDFLLALAADPALVPAWPEAVQTALQAVRAAV